MIKKPPKGWKTLELDEIAFVQTGIAINGEPDRTNPIRLPYLRVANVQDGHIDLSEIKYITVSEHQVARYALQVGDVLMTEGGDFDKLGRGAVWKGEFAPCLHQNHVFAVRPDQAQVLPAFLAAYCESAAGKRYFLSCSKQTTNLASINSTQLKEMPVVVPPLLEQRRIISVLNAWDQAIDEAESLAAAKRRRYRGMLHSLVGCAFDDSPSNVWVPYNLGQLFTERDERSADLPLLAITGEHGVVPRDELDRRQTASEDKSKYKVIRPNDIGFNTMRMWQGVFGKSAYTGIVSPAYTVVTAIAGLCDPTFISHLFSHPKAVSLFRRYSQGLVDDTLMLKFPQFAEISMRLPDIERQRAIGEILEGERADLLPQGRYLAYLRTQKRGLMQKLLTGEWRLDERFDAEALSSRSLKVGGRS